ncbi:hypothetical protein [Phenylobacterium sp.]|uniref:hypothetical protein n=1 Tax=Phenylobacterium sp. TaxID=1871053 RepID=UPI0035B0AA05
MGDYTIVIITPEGRELPVRFDGPDDATVIAEAGRIPHRGWRVSVARGSGEALEPMGEWDHPESGPRWSPVS